jgi:hypothetical protein
MNSLVGPFILPYHDASFEEQKAFWNHFGATLARELQTLFCDQHRPDVYGSYTLTAEAYIPSSLDRFAPKWKHIIQASFTCVQGFFTTTGSFDMTLQRGSWAPRRFKLPFEVEIVEVDTQTYSRINSMSLDVSNVSLEITQDVKDVPVQDIDMDLEALEWVSERSADPLSNATACLLEIVKDMHGTQIPVQVSFLLDHGTTLTQTEVYDNALFLEFHPPYTREHTEEELEDGDILPYNTETSSTLESPSP